MDTSVVAVCEHCRSVVARGDARLEDIGKTNEILSTGSVLHLGLRGTVRAAGQSHTFEIVGRTQLRHPAGGVWDEWYAALEGGRWIWIAEHQGKLAITSEKDARQGPNLSLATALPGKEAMTSRGMMRVIERGIATVVAEEGELPWRAAPNEKRAFIDLAGPDGSFGTLDLGPVKDGVPAGPTRWFLGKETTVDELGLRDAVVHVPALRKVEGNQQLSCPRCRAPLERNVDTTQSLACPSCASVLSVEEEGRLEFLFAQQKRKPKIPLGRKATLEPTFFRHAENADERRRLEVEVVGFVIREVTIDGVDYEFEEYLLHTERDGYFWLVQSDAHWSFVWPLSPGAVQTGRHPGLPVRYAGRAFKPYQASTPRVKYVAGELYWKVNAGESSTMVDYIRPPYMLSEDLTHDEVNWSKALYIEVEDVRRAFGVELGAPTGVGANQPSPWREPLRTGGVLAVGASLLLWLLTLAVPSRTVLDQHLELTPPATVTNHDPGNKFSVDQLHLRAARNVVVDLFVADPYGVWFSGELYEKATGRVRAFASNVENRHARVYLSAPRTGEHALNLLIRRTNYHTTSTARLVVLQGHPSLHWLSMLGLCLGVSWLFLTSCSASFEKKRMENSMYGGDGG